MSALTKVFVVLLVVVSLLSAAGFIVFVNSTEHFKETLEAAKARGDQATAALTAAKTEAAAIETQRMLLAQQLDTATQNAATAAAAAERQIAQRDATIAADNSKATIAAASLANVGKALDNSEASRLALAQALTTERAQIDTLNKNIMDDEVALGALQSQRDVSITKIRTYEEEIAQYKIEADALKQQVAQLGGTPGVAVAGGGLSVGVPINGVVQDARDIKGIPYATINVGSAEQVTKGMVFQVIDRNRAKFLGRLTVDTVDLHNATGKLDGPYLADIHAGAEAKTQL